VEEETGRNGSRPVGGLIRQFFVEREKIPLYFYLLSFEKRLAT
jgi:hypothetical protein